MTKQCDLSACLPWCVQQASVQPICSIKATELTKPGPQCPAPNAMRQRTWCVRQPPRRKDGESSAELSEDAESLESLQAESEPVGPAARPPAKPQSAPAHPPELEEEGRQQEPDRRPTISRKRPLCSCCKGIGRLRCAGLREFRHTGRSSWVVWRLVGQASRPLRYARHA